MPNYEGFIGPAPDEEPTITPAEALGYLEDTLEELLSRAGRLALQHATLPPTASMADRIKLHTEAARFRAEAEFVEQFTEEYQALTA